MHATFLFSVGTVALDYCSWTLSRSLAFSSRLANRRTASLQLCCCSAHYLLSFCFCFYFCFLFLSLSKFIWHCWIAVVFCLLLFLSLCFVFGIDHCHLSRSVSLSRVSFSPLSLTADTAIIYRVGFRLGSSSVAYTLQLCCVDTTDDNWCCTDSCSCACSCS